MRRMLLLILCVSPTTAGFAGENASDKSTRFFEAAKDGRVAEVRAGLADGADAKMIDTALLVASQNGHIEVVTLLLEHRDTATVNGLRAAVFMAAREGRTEVLRLLLEKDTGSGNKILALYVASGEGHTEAVKLLLEKGADVNVAVSLTADAPRVTPLMRASVNGHAEIVRLLLEKGADVNVKQLQGVTALWLASTERHVEVVKLLIEKGADVNVKGTEMGMTPLWWAAANGHTEMVELLLDHGADVNLETDGSTPLSAAREQGHTEIVELLERAGSQKATRLPPAKTPFATADPADGVSSMAPVKTGLAWVRHHPRNLDFTIDLPGKWQIGEKDSGEGGPAFFALSPTELLMDAYSENVSVTVAPADGSSLDDLNARSIRTTRQNATEFQLLDQGLSRMGANDAAWYTYTHRLQGVVLKVVRVGTINAERLYVITCTALPLTFDQYQPLFERIAASIAFDEPEAEMTTPIRSEHPTDGRSVDAIEIATILGVLAGGLLGAFVLWRSLIRRDKRAPQAELQPGSSRSCSIPGVIAGILVIGVGVVNLWAYQHPELAMRIYVVGAWLFAGAAIIARSFLGPFGLVRMLVLFFGAFLVWLSAPLLPGEFRVAQAAGSAEAYGEFFGRLFVLGLGVVLFVFGFKRRKEISSTPPAGSGTHPPDGGEDAPANGPGRSEDARQGAGEERERLDW